MGIILRWTRITPYGTLEWEARPGTKEEAKPGDVFLDEGQCKALDANFTT